MAGHGLKLVCFFIGIICHVLGSSPPLTENELSTLDAHMRNSILHPKEHHYSARNHSTRTSHFKSKYVSNSGYIYDEVQIFTETINIDATQSVSDSTLYKAANTVAHMVRHMPSDIFSNVATQGHGVGIFTKEDTVVAFPENAHLADTPECHAKCSGSCAKTCTVDGRKFLTSAGLTNTRSVVLDSNVACAADDPYGHKESILVHEFGHLIMRYLPKEWRDKIFTTYNYCLAHNVWDNNAYGMANADEYWAEATSAFFMTIIRDGPAAGLNKCNFRAICTSEQAARDWLKLRDPWLFNVLSHVYTNGQPTTPSGLHVCM